MMDMRVVKLPTSLAEIPAMLREIADEIERDMPVVSAVIVLERADSAGVEVSGLGHAEAYRAVGLLHEAAAQILEETRLDQGRPEGA
jgi:uncharacterized protein (DUF2236 family)